MAPASTQRNVWALARRQHGVVSRRQLRALGFTDEAIRHRVRKGRLHRLWPDVFAVGRPLVERDGVLMAAVLTCGAGAVVSHHTAAEIWGIRPKRRGPIHVSVPSPRDPRRGGIKVHRRRSVEGTLHRRVPVTAAAQTVIDIAPDLTERELERAIDEADKLDVVHPRQLHEAARGATGAGARIVRDLLGKRTFLLTDSELERLFLPIAEAAGLERPETQVSLHGHRVDFFFRGRDLVVEADGGRYHRTPSQQRRDRIREHALGLAAIRVVRFTQDQIAHEPEYVARILRRL